MSFLLPKPGGESLTLGIMGVFDPIHIEHLVTAEEARQQFGLDYVVFIPAGVPRIRMRKNKFCRTSCMMTMLAVVDNPYFTVSRLEIERRKPSYTIDTVQYFSDL